MAWTVLYVDHVDQNYKRILLCVCSCGNVGLVRQDNLKSGRSKQCSNCGKWNNKRRRTHGFRNNREYQIWIDMRRRCYDPNRKGYEHYGGRGITYDKSWDNFITFYKDMGKCPDGYSLERIDVNGNYCKDNCKWIPLSDQSKNRRCTKKYA